MSDQQDQQDFQPYAANSSMRKVYSPEEDEHIWDTVNFATNEGITKDIAFGRLAEELDRNPKAIEVRYYIIKKRKEGRTDTTDVDDDEDEDNDDSLGFLKKLKSVVKDQNNYKAKYEAVKADYDKLSQEHEKLMRELNKIRRLFED